MASRNAQGKRIPAPPVRREVTRVERVGGTDSSRGKGSRARQGDGGVDVSEVVMRGVSGDTDNKLRGRLAEAAVAYERERFGDAERLLRSIDKLAPDVPEVVELLGLSAYRRSHWREAIRELERFEALVGSVEQHPVLADAYRARGNHDKVKVLWLELGADSPSAELVEEGRIVFAGSLADQDLLKDAIRTLESAPKVPKRPKPHHLRRWYALADLYERSGDLGRAKRLFREIREADSDFGDVDQRIRQLR